MEEIKVNLPENLSDLPKRVRQFFKASYQYEKQEVLQLRNCFITFNGIVLSRLKFVKECFYRPKKYKRKYYPWALKLYILSFVTRWGRQHRIELNDNRTYALIHQPYINYFHWMIESLTRYLLLEKSKKAYQLVIPSNLIEVSFIKDSLDLLGITNYTVVNSDSTVHVSDLLLPALVRWGTHNHPAMMLELRERLLSRFHFMHTNLSRDMPERLFLVREKGRRKIINLEKVLEVVKKFDFFVIDFEGLSLAQQMAMMSKVRVFVAPHGAGLTNMLFMPSGGKIIEIHIDPVQNSNAMDLSYYHLSSNLGHQYYSLISDKHDATQDPFFADHVVPITPLHTLLARLNQLN